MLKSRMILATFALLAVTQACTQRPSPVGATLSRPSNTPPAAVSTPTQPRWHATLAARWTHQAQATLAAANARATLPVGVPPTPSLTLPPTGGPLAYVPLTPHPLSAEGPYFAYLRQEDAAFHIVVSDFRTLGTETFPLPSDVADQVNYDTRPFGTSSLGISPDGKYFAYEVGTTEYPFDLELRVLRLQDQQLVTSIPIMRQDMDSSIAKLASQARADLAIELADEPSELWPEELLFSMQVGIRTFEWSPVEPLLAFVAQRDGPSSDLYLLDPFNPAPRRLTSGLRNIQRLDWSPNGQWIAHGAAYTVGINTPVRNYIASRRGSPLLELPEGGQEAAGWTTSDWYLVYEAANGPGSFALKAMYLPSRTYTTLWSGTFESFALDPSANLLAVSVDEPWTYEYERGTYLADLRTHAIKRIGDPLFFLTLWAHGPDHFLGSGDGMFAISDEGAFRPILDSYLSISVSPAHDKVVLYSSYEHATAYVLDADLNSLFDIPSTKATCIVWSPNSDSFLLLSDNLLLSVSVAEEVPRLVDDHVPSDWGSCPISVLNQ